MYDMGVRLCDDLFGFEDEVDQDLSPGAVERYRVLILALSQHLRCRDAGHLLDRPVPGDDGAVRVDRERGIGKEVEDIRLAPFMIQDGGIRLPLLDGLADLVGEFGELCPGIASLLEVEVSTVVDRLDHDLLSTSPGEEDERGGVSR